MLVKVHNDNIHPYNEKFSGQDIHIPAISYIEMDEDQAEVFLGKFVFPVKNEMGLNDPKFFKKLRIEKPLKENVEADSLICHATGKKAASKEELVEMLSSFRHLLVRDDEAEEFAKKAESRLKKENKDLKSRLEKLEALVSERLGISLDDKKDEAA